MDKTDRLRDYGLAFLLYEHGLGVCGYELIRELFIFIKLILNSYLITGSNARMLSRELGTHLTGRYIQVELYPFSFKEYLSLKEIPVNAKTLYTTTGRATLVNAFVNFMQCGGFPKYLQEDSVSYLSSLYESIIYRDILTRNGLTNEKRCSK